MSIALHFLLMAPLLFGSVGQDSTKPPQEESADAWHQRRIRSLQRDLGWLTLVALDWLNEGENQVAGIGPVTLKNGKVSIRIPDSVTATVNGKPFSSGEITPEGGEVLPDTLRIPTKTAVVIRRGDRFAIRVWDKEAKTRKEFTSIDRYPVSERWRIEARWQPYDLPKQIRVPTVIPGLEEDYPVPGVAVFNVDGKEYRLEPVLEEPNGDYFFIFGDKTNGSETYGAGRFLYTKPASDGKVIINFNKAYNPPCAFTEFATCPLPPQGNKLPIRVDAGEKKYGGH
ncbi:MAG: DUF1684 domain-containing protein [Bacteroidota bacterium]